MDSNYTNLKAVKPTGTKQPRKRFSSLNISTLEYGIIANLVEQNYQRDGKVAYEALLSIPQSERLPGLIEKYGKKTVHRLLVMILRLGKQEDFMVIRTGSAAACASGFPE